MSLIAHSCSLGDTMAGLPCKTEQKQNFFSHVVALK